MLPGWNSLESVTSVAKLFTVLGWIALGSLVPLEVIAHIYSEREKVLSAAQQKTESEAVTNALRRENSELRSGVTALRTRTEFRRLIAEQKERVASKLKKFHGIKFGLVLYNAGDDASSIADDIRDALTGPSGAGWENNAASGTSASAPGTGIVIEVNPSSKNKEASRAAGELADALRGENLFVPPVRPFTPSDRARRDIMGAGWDVMISIETRP